MSRLKSRRLTTKPDQVHERDLYSNYVTLQAGPHVAFDIYIE